MPSTEAEVAARMTDPKDDYIHVVAAIVWHRDGSRFLIARRPKGKHLQDLWEFPGGKREPGESPIEALRRELREEIGINLVTAEPLLQVYHRYPDRNILLDTWTVDDYEGDVQPVEQQALAWIGLDQMADFRFPEADLPVLEAIEKLQRAAIE